LICDRSAGDRGAIVVYDEQIRRMVPLDPREVARCDLSTPLEALTVEGRA
jgi:hypothetical protein